MLLDQQYGLAARRQQRMLARNRQRYELGGGHGLVMLRFAPTTHQPKLNTVLEHIISMKGGYTYQQRLWFRHQSHHPDSSIIEQGASQSGVQPPSD